MKPTILLLFCLALCGCNQAPSHKANSEEVIRTLHPLPDIGRVILDGHVYFVPMSAGSSLTHSEGCTNVIHARVAGSDWRYLGPRYGSQMGEPHFVPLDGPAFPQFPKGYIENPELVPRDQTIQRDIPSIITEPTEPTRKEK